MEIQPIVIGTAGHIDHGKSTLVRSLTGVDPDRLKEEKERGLTIDLGFAPLELPDGRLVGIVDVPGHERFIRNMVAGATGIDLVLLVIAADDGVMPQTREHMQIMQLLGVERGMIALTKIDKVDDELVDLVEEDVRESVATTFLAEAPIVRVSAKSGEGLDALRECVFTLAAEAEPRASDGVFRMPIQRVFSKSGFGTVVTGIPVSGQASVGDLLEVLPQGTRGKVRGLNAYKQKTEHIRSGHSAALNLSDIEHASVSRGDVVASPGFFSAQRMVAARLLALPSLDRAVKNRMPVRLHTGTSDIPGELVLLDKEELAPGESGLVQLRLADPVICAPGDPFVLRLLSPVVTLGGGTILEESRYRLKRFKGFVLDELTRQEGSLESPAALLESLLVRQAEALVSTEDLTKAIKRSRAETRELLSSLVAEKRVVSPRADRWIHADRMASATQGVRREVEAWFAAESHRSVIDVLELRKRCGLDKELLAILLEAEEAAGRLQLASGGKIRLAGRTAELSPAEEELSGEVRRRYVAARFQPPLPSLLVSELRRTAPEVQKAIENLVDAGELERIGGEVYLAQEAIDEAREAIRENCTKHGDLQIPELRDRLKTSRKYLIPILEYFDAKGLTLRQAGRRVLRTR